MAKGKMFIKKYKIDFDAEPAPRNVFILMDGTWNDESGIAENNVTTNIHKLYQILSDDSTTQIKRYFRGIGNDEDNTWFQRLTHGAFGLDEKRIRDDAYCTICKDYHPGDHIFIFGFSRGAASARMLASDLNKKGIPEEIEIYTRPTANRRSNNIEYKFEKYTASQKTMSVDVQFLGVWDTVYAFNIPKLIFGISLFNRTYDLFNDKHVASNVQHAIHIVAIDETRKVFKPTLMNHDPERILEVWFPGVHSDVGGGYEEDEMGRITLNYMLQKLDECCGKHNFHPVEYKSSYHKDKVIKLGKKNVVLHFHGLNGKKEVRYIEVIKNDKIDKNIKPKVHFSFQQIRTSANVYSKQEFKNFFRKPLRKFFRIIYNPPGIRRLLQNYTIVR
ncbi:MAG: DUF2235 domain-containing protein [Bacteroidota bacterium]